MILERLSVAGFRSFGDPFEFRPGPKLTVIHAPNGTGKSTLLEALYCGLLERHNTQGESLNAKMKPNGRNLTPEIEIDFEVDGTRYRLVKKFLSASRSTMLERFEAGSYRRFQQDHAADDYLREMFCAEAPGRGAIKDAAHYGLAHILFAPSRASYEKLPTLANDRITSILSAGAVAITVGEQLIKEAVVAEYTNYFSIKSKKYAENAGSANIPFLHRTYDDARSSQDQARFAYDRLDKLNVEYEDRRAELERIESRQAANRSELEAARKAVAAFNASKLEGERTARIRAEAKTLFNTLEETRIKLERLRAERAQATSLHVERVSVLKKAIDDEVMFFPRLAGARTAAENCQAELNAVQKRAAEVSSAETYARTRAVLSSEAEKLGSIDDLGAKRGRATAERAETLAPKSAEIEDLRKTVESIAVQQATILAAALTLELEPHSAITIEVISGAQSGPIPLVPGTSCSIASDGELIAIDIPGFGRVRAIGADGAAKARTKLRTLEEKRDSAFALYTATTLDELYQRRECADGLDRTIHDIDKRVTELLGAGSEIDLRTKVAEHRTQVATIEHDFPTWREAPPDAGALRSAFDRDLLLKTTAFNDANANLQAAQSAKSEIEAKLASARQREALAAAELTAINAQLAPLEIIAGNDATRTEAERKAARAFRVAEDDDDRAIVALRQYAEDPNLTTARLELEQSGAAEEYATTHERCAKARATLELQSSLGSYATLASAEETTERRLIELQTAVTEAEAIKCLYNAFADVEASRIARVIEPIATSANAFFQRITGFPIGNIAIGSGFTPTNLVERTTGISLSIEDGTLSSGEKEQIYIATRLALADVLAGHSGRQLLVIDDAMTATDPGRLRRFAAILEELSHDRLQIIVTTADNSRYLGIRGAQQFDLRAELDAKNAA